jgi:hypothetical protein
VVAAFGDNLIESAERAATQLSVAPDDLARLRELGALLNYNAYGDSVADLCYHPAELHVAMRGFRDPFDFMKQHPAFGRLALAYAEDQARVRKLRPLTQTPAAVIYLLPQAAWCRRISGAFANQLARDDRERAQAVITPAADGVLRVSVRAPRGSAANADALCREFPGGGGRREAAGINALPAAQLEPFCLRFAAYFS